jgi:hypothetical protein
MSPTPETPDRPIGGNGPGPGDGPYVLVSIDAPEAATPLYVGVPFKVEGSAESSGKVAGVTLTFDGATVPTTDDSTAHDWSSWHADITPASTGTHTLVAAATGAGKTSSKTVQAQAYPVLTCVSPAPSAGVITTSVSPVVLGIQIGTPAFNGGTITWQYQLPSTPWAQPTTAAKSSSSSLDWQLTIPLPPGPVGKSGAVYPLQIRATTAPGGLSATLALTIHAVDTSPPQLLSFTPADGQEFTAGAAPTVTVQVTDQPAGAVFSGVPAGGVTLQFDGRPLPITQTAAGDPSTWSATLAALTHAVHTVTVTVTDTAGNTTTATHSLWVALTSWTRLESVPLDPTLMEGLQARIADPLWLLARQAAFGEFTGKDSASPVSVRLRARASSLTRLQPGLPDPTVGPGEQLPADGGPLETLTEAEPEPDTSGAARPLFAAQAGLHYLRLLARADGIGDLTTYKQGLLTAYPIPPPAPAPGPGIPPALTAGDPALQPYIGHVPDGTRLYADLAAALHPPGGGGALPATPPLGGASPAAVASAAQAWLAWYEAVTGQELGHRDTWAPERMEYAVSISSPGPDAETVLAAAELDTGELDWFDFDLLASSKIPPAAPPVSLGAVPADLPGGDTPIVFVGLPSPVAYWGMPRARWWDFEDASIDFGAVTAPAESLTTSLIVEFAMRYGNDHFIIPVPLDTGSVLRTDSLVVTDTFGEVLRIRPICEVDTAAGPFRLFEHTVPAGTGGTPARDPLFVLFPTLGQVLQGPALEEVHFIRDENAEIVWAIEQTALGPAGQPTDRTADALAHFQPDTPTPNGATALPTRAYILRTDVEANWFPFLLQDPANGAQLAMADVPPLDTSQPAPLPWGRILAPFAPTAPGPGQPLQPGVLLPLEEVTRVGAQVTRGWRYARWIDGRHLAWVGRRARPGRGPGSSGLSFDLAL